MSQPYLRGQALLTACAAGTGVIVVVEGETYQDDPYFYTRWFGDRAREVSFFPQNGWVKVVTAVADLRAALPGRKVFGIIDRDFVDDAALAAQATQVPVDGVFRLSRYTLENYLLEPAGWLEVARLIHRGAPPLGCETEGAIAAQIEGAYKKCIRVGAFNRTIHEEHVRLPEEGLPYREHPDAVDDAERALAAWGARRKSPPPQPLEAVFGRHVTAMEHLPVSELSRFVTGKAVVKVFAQQLSTWKKKGLPWETLLDLYLDKAPSPPQEIADLVTRIVERDGRP